jgi:hypothetical protein
MCRPTIARAGQLFGNMTAMKPIDIVVTISRRNIIEQEPNTCRHICRLLKKFKVPIYQLCVISHKDYAFSLVQNRQDAAKKTAPKRRFIMMCYSLTGCGQRGITVKNQFVRHFV